MMSRSRLLVAVLLAAVSTAAATTTAAAQRRGAITRISGRDYRSRIDTTVALDRSGVVTVIAGSGDVIITGVTGNQMHVRAVSDDDNIRFDYVAGRNSVELTARTCIWL